MEAKSKYLFTALSLLLIGVFVATYYTSFIAEDYLIEVSIACDPSTESCFIYRACDEIEQCESTYYKSVIAPNAFLQDHCGETPEECEIDCTQESTGNCHIVYCAQDTDQMCAAPTL